MAVSKCEKITEHNLRRVLTCSICSILVCLMCLAGTTWAWFTVELNAGVIEIQTGRPVQIQASITDQNSTTVPVTDATTLEGGTSYSITMTLPEEPARDELGYANEVYAIMTMVVSDGEKETSESYYVVFGEDQEDSFRLSDVYVANGTTVRISFDSAWFCPDNAFPLYDESMMIGEEPEEEEPEEPSVEEREEADPEPTQDTEDNIPDTQATQETEESTLPDSEPTQETEDSTQPDTDPTEQTQESTQPSSEFTEATQARLEPTEAPDESTDASTQPEE